METKILPASEEAIQEAAQLLPRWTAGRDTY